MRFLEIYQSMFCASLVMILAGYLVFVSSTMVWWLAIPFNLIGAFFVFLYEMFIERPIGVLGGPGVPFVNRELMARIRKKISP